MVAVALGACLVERHITLDRAMWGSDQAASVEPQGFERLVKYVRVTEQSLGDGVKKVYESEIPSMRKLRRFINCNHFYGLDRFQGYQGSPSGAGCRRKIIASLRGWLRRSSVIRQATATSARLRSSTLPAAWHG